MSGSSKNRTSINGCLYAIDIILTLSKKAVKYAFIMNGLTFTKSMSDFNTLINVLWSVIGKIAKKKIITLWICIGGRFVTECRPVSSQSPARRLRHPRSLSLDSGPIADDPGRNRDRTLVTFLPVIPGPGGWGWPDTASVLVWEIGHS